MEKAVILEAASAEESLVGVECLDTRQRSYGGAMCERGERGQ